MSSSSIWPIDRTLSGATTPDECGPSSNDNEGVFRIPQTFCITGVSPSDCLVSYPGHSLGVGSYRSVKKQSVYSTAPANWDDNYWSKWIFEDDVYTNDDMYFFYTPGFIEETALRELFWMLES